MSEPFATERIVHVIHAVDDYNATRVRYMNVLGALVFAEHYHPDADRDMNLFYVADFMIEPMAPRRTPRAGEAHDGPAAMASIYANYLDRYGEGWHSFELAVDNLPGVIENLSAQGIRVSPGVPFTHPRDAFGFCIEMIPKGMSMPGDPIGYRGWNPRWFEGNPMTLEGIAAIAHTVTAVGPARDFLVNTFGAVVLDEDAVDRPEPMERSRVELAGVELLLLAPTGTSGPVTEQVSRRGFGIYSLVWKVASQSDARQRLAQLGIRVQEGSTALGDFAIDPADMFGARHEFLET
ncbi:MAG TPA: VOC family protein [Acidimicrobiales bacterium]